MNQLEYIQTRCDQMLQEVHRVDIMTDGKESSEELKGKYNQLLQRLESLRPTSPVDPLTIFPPEIWTGIIQEATTENGMNLLPIDALLVLTSVSRGWNSKLLNTATLWTGLTIGVGEADARAKLQTSLFLSKNLPLTLRFHQVPCHWAADLSLLQPHVNRIQQIVFLTSARRTLINDENGGFMDMISSLGNLPALAIVSGFTVHWDDIYKRFPNLAYVYDMPTPMNIVESRKGILRSCYIEAMASDIISYHEALSHLDNLSWWVQNEENTKLTNVALPRLLGLKRIHINTAPNATFFTALKLACNLTDLKIIIINWQHLYDTFSLFPYLPHLVVLNLSIAVVPHGLVWPSIEPTVTKVYDLRILHLIDRGRVDRSTETNQNQEAFFSVFPTYFPNVTRLSIDYAFLGPELAAYIRLATRLSALDFFVVQVQHGYKGSLESSSLESLVISGEASMLANIKNLTCPSLLHITFDIWRIDMREHDWACHHSTYGRVERLQIKTSESLLWQIDKFNALRTLKIGDPNEPDGVSASPFLVLLIFEPSACPFLAEIDLASVPEWDLLFLMLERRNYLPRSQGVTRIATVILPSPIPYVLLAPLTAVVAGHFAERPSNWDLSFSALMEVYFDPSIPGCWRCLNSMSTCSAALFISVAHIFTPSDMDLPSGDFTVPAYIWNWLQNRKERLAQWYIQRNIWRKSTVERHRLCTEMKLAQRPFIVTAHTLRVSLEEVYLSTGMA